MSWRGLVVLAAIGVLAYIVGYLALVMIPLAIALLLAALLSPAVGQLARRRVPRSLAVVLVMIAGLIGVAGVLTGVISAFAAGLPALQTQLGQSLAAINGWLTHGPLHLPPHTLQNAFNRLLATLKHNQASVATGVLSTAVTLGEALTAIALTIFILIFFLRDGDHIWRFLLRAAPAGVRSPIDRAGRAGFTTLVRYVRATILVAAGDAIGIGIGLWAVGVPLALPLAALVFLGAFIPIIGAVTTGSIAVLVALVANGFLPALIVLGVVLVVMQVEGNVLQPLLMGHAVKLHPLAVVLVIAMGSVIAGIPGALLAVPTLAVLNTAIRVLLGHPPPDGDATGADDRQPRHPLRRRHGRLSDRLGIRRITSRGPR
ncbi:MAG: AI-2E family transporter [Sciscionella sp.]